MNRFGSRGVVSPFVWQPTRAGLQGLGQLGLSSSATGAAGGAAGGAATGAAVGSIVPGIGTAIGAAAGAIVGAITGLLGGKSNPQIQIDKTSAQNFFGQYANLAGTVSGRSIGLNNMDMVLRGACFAGHFPKWGNKTELPDSLLSMPGSPYGGNDNCFKVLWAAARTGAKAPGTSGVNTGNGNVPVRDAKTFVDRYVWPSNTADVDTNPWVTTTDAIGKQIIYDAADAYLAQQDPTTVPLIGQTLQAAANVSLPPTSAPAPPPVNPVGSASSAGPTVLTADGSTVAPGSNTALRNPQGQVFTLGPPLNAGGNAIYVNGAPTNNGAGSAIGLLLSGGQVYAQNALGSWYRWNGSTDFIAISGSPLAPPPVSNPVPPPAPPLPSSSQLTLTAPAMGSPITLVPDMGKGGLATQVPANLVFAGLDPTNSSWILHNTGDGRNYVLWQGNVIPYQPSMFSPSVVTPVGSGTIPQVTTASPSATVATTTAGTAVTQADLQALIAQLAAQGQSATQAYTSALQTLQANGVVPTAAVQSAVQSAVQATPAPVTPTTAGVSGLGWVGLLAVGATLLLATARPVRTPGRRKRR
jgi:hypothetical protein